MQEKIKRDLGGFVVLKQDQLKEWEQQWGQDVLKARLKQYNLQYLLRVYSSVPVEGPCMRSFQL